MMNNGMAVATFNSNSQGDHIHYMGVYSIPLKGTCHIIQLHLRHQKQFNRRQSVTRTNINVINEQSNKVIIMLTKGSVVFFPIDCWNGVWIFKGGPPPFSYK